MHNPQTHIRKPPIAGTALILVLACLILSACGDSSSKSTASKSTNANAATTSSSTPTRTAPKKRFGGTAKPSGHAARRRFGTPAFRKALTAFAACMNRNGVKLSAPNTSGNGPVFNTQSLDTKSASFKAASTKCQRVLRSALPRPPRTARAPQ